jgi:DNA-binding MarR family transcriptional regulator
MVPTVGHVAAPASGSAGAVDGPATVVDGPAGGSDRTYVAGRLAVVVGRLDRRIRATAHDLTYGQLSALSSIVRFGPLRPGDLARLESITAPSITRVIAGLDEIGLITRTPDPADGRAFFIQATTAGHQAVLRVRAQRAERLRGVLEDCTDDQIVQIGSALDVLEAAAQIQR